MKIGSFTSSISEHGATSGLVTLHYSAITCESVHRVNWSRVSRSHNRLQTLTVNGGIAVGLIFINMVCKRDPPLSVGGASCRGKKNICKCSFIQKESLIVAKTFVSRTVCNCYRPARNKKNKTTKKTNNIDVGKHTHKTLRRKHCITAAGKRMQTWTESNGTRSV